MSLGSDLWVCFSLTPRPFADLTDVTLADEDTNSILTNNANRAIIDNVAMQVAPPGGQTCSYMQATPPGGQTWNQCKWHYMLAKFGTESGGITWWPKELKQVEPHVGQI